MDAPALTPDQFRELAALRRRAYGPDADIGAVDVARMEALEALARPAPDSVGDVVATDLESGGELPADEVEREASAPSDALPGAMPVPSERGPVAGSRWRRRVTRRAAVFGAAVLAFLVVVWGVSQWVGPQPDRTLRPLVTTGDDEPTLGVVEAQALRAFGVDTDDVREYDGYESFRVWVANAANGQRCLAVYAGSYGPSVSCTPRGLDPTVDVIIYDGMSPVIQRGLPQGSVIRWVLSGDDVLVWERVLSTEL